MVFNRSNAQPDLSAFAAAQPLLDGLEVPLAVLDAAGCIVQVNAAWTRRMLVDGALPAGSAVGGDYGHGFRTAARNATDGQAVADGLRRLLDQQDSAFGHEYPQGVGAATRWTRVQLRAVHQGPQLYVLVTDQDVTNTGRTDQLSEELRQATARNAQLDEANHDLEGFAASVSHDLRAPVRHIQGFLHSLTQRLAGRTTPEEDKLLDILAVSASRLGTMVDELLGLARRGRQPMQPQPLALGQVFERAWRQLGPERTGRRVVWRVHPLPTVQGDIRLLEYAVVNLLSNALKYTAHCAEPQVEVSALDEPQRWVVRVADNGAGFDVRFSERLFTPFQRLHSERDYQGVGMGLANVKRIVERHGGQVWAEARPGQGAVFSFSLPKH